MYQHWNANIWNNTVLTARSGTIMHDNQNNEQTNTPMI